jgi:hypothetical protein
MPPPSPFTPTELTGTPFDRQYGRSSLTRLASASSSFAEYRASTTSTQSRANSPTAQASKSADGLR